MNARAARVPGFTVHPGELMREILTEHLKMPIAEAARRMQISRPTLYAVLNGTGGVTAD
jgi:plasmid maintenance system antidote protein VapI